MTTLAEFAATGEQRATPMALLTADGPAED